MPLSSKIIDLISIAGKAPSGIIQKIDPLVSLTLRHELTLYNGHLPFELEEEFEQKIKELSEKIEEHKTQHYENSEIRSLAQTVLTSKIKDLVDEVRAAVATTPKTEVTKWDPCSVTFEAPPHLMSMQFPGIEPGKVDPKKFVFCLSRTIPPHLILISKDWPKYKSGHDIDFVVGITNCEVDPNFHERRVTEKTLVERGASEDDIEVFDAIHEFERLYGPESFKLGIITLRSQEELETVGSKSELIKEDYGLTELITKHCEAVRDASEKDPRSCLIRLVTESKNLSKDSIDEILEKIPFATLAGMAIDDVCIDIMSCNTIEVTEILTEALKKIAQRLEIKISANFYDGYIQNNNSFCYLSESEQEKLTLELVRRMEAGEEMPTIPLAWQQQRDYMKDRPTPKGKLLQVVTPGFSNIAATNLDELTENYVVTKGLRPIALEPSEPRSSPVSPETDSPPEKEGLKSPKKSSPLEEKVFKKLMRPISEIPQGRTWKWIADFREQTQEITASGDIPNAVASTRAAMPVVPNSSIIQLA